MQNDQLLVIDNYDSFTYNVVRYLKELGAEPCVIRNDEYNLKQIIASRPRAIVVSPGPCTPNDAGISLAAIEYFSAQKTPILGVCLGHQAIGQVFGAVVVRARRVVHGKASRIYHRGGRLFSGVPSPAVVARYHSLILDVGTIPDCLSVEAWLEDDIEPVREGGFDVNPQLEAVVMAIAHKTLPVHGVQFHPESILSEYGHKIFENFLDLYDLKKTD